MDNFHGSICNVLIYRKGVANLGDGYGFPSEHGLVDYTGPLHQDNIALDSVAPVGGEEDVISRDQLCAG